MRISDWSSDVCSSDLLHFARGITFGVDVADFLELQRPFERQRIIGAASQIEHVARGRDRMRHRLDRGVLRQRGVERGGRLGKMPHDRLLLAVGQPVLGAREVDRERQIGRAWWRERVCEEGYISVVPVALKKKKK